MVPTIPTTLASPFLSETLFFLFLLVNAFGFGSSWRWSPLVSLVCLVNASGFGSSWLWSPLVSLFFWSMPLGLGPPGFGLLWFRCFFLRCMKVCWCVALVSSIFLEMYEGNEREGERKRKKERERDRERERKRQRERKRERERRERERES